MNKNNACIRRILSMLSYNVPLHVIYKTCGVGMTKAEFYDAYQTAIVFFRMEQDEK
jgi:hypothetical protein